MKADMFKSLFIIVLIVFSIFSFLCSYFNLFSDMENIFLDLRFRFRRNIKVSDKILIIGITEDCLKELGRWPISRKYHVELLKKLKDSNVAAIGYDIAFVEKAKYDEVLLKYVKQIDNLILPVFGSSVIKVNNGTITVARVIKNIFKDAKTGHVNILTDKDGIVRRIYPFIESKERYCAFAIKNKKKVYKKSINIKDKPIYINFAGPSGMFDILPFSQALKYKDLTGALEGKIVLVGGFATGLFDLHSTPFSVMYGIELQANILNMYLTNSILYGLSDVSNGVISLFVTVLAGMLPMLFYGVINFVLFGFLIFIYLGLSLLLFKAGIIIPVFVPLVFAVVIFMLGLTLKILNLYYSYKIKEAHLNSVIVTSKLISQDNIQSTLLELIKFLHFFIKFEAAAICFIEEGECRIKVGDLKLTQEKLKLILNSDNESEMVVSPLSSIEQIHIIKVKILENIICTIIFKGDFEPECEDIRTLNAISSYIASFMKVLYLTEKLKSKDIYLRNLLNTTRTGVLTLARNMEVLTVNKSLNEILKTELEPGEKINVSVLKSYELFNLIKEVIEQDKTIEINELKISLDKSDIYLKIYCLPIELMRDPITNEARKGAALFIEDFTSIKKLYEKLRLQDKLASVGNLAASIVHEIKNPLSVIRGSAELLALDSEDKEELVAFIMGEVDRLNNIVRGILNYTKPKATKFKKENLNNIIKSYVDIVKYDLRKSKVELIEELGSNLPPLVLDKAQITQLLLNLIMNAKHAMSESSVKKLTLKTSFDKEKKCVKLLIEDTGCGMDEETLANIFKPFFTTKEFGTGLGLAICYDVVSRHKAQMNVESSPGKGTKFEILFEVEK